MSANDNPGAPADRGSDAPADEDPDDGSTPDEPYPREEVAAVVADLLSDAARPGGTVRDATPVEEGKNTVYAVTVETDASEDAGPRDFVLKVGDHHFAAGCRAEPYLLERVAERTAVPVPEVVGVGHLDGEPCFLAERIPGKTPTGGPTELPPETVGQVCAEAGRNLARLHDAIPADGWGLLGVERGANDLEFVREFDDWPTHVEEWLSHNVERLADTRFADLCPALAERAESVADDLRDLGPFDPVVTHGDYRFANLVVDPERDPVTTAVLDWATPVAATRCYELAVTEAILVDRPGFDADRKRRLRERLYESYRATTDDLPAREAFEARRRCYLFGARLRLMVNLREEMADRSEAATDARAREHRDALREYGVE